MSLPEGVTIEEGRFYKRRDGLVVGPACPTGDEMFPWRASGCSYTAAGRYLRSFTYDFDLVGVVERNGTINPPAGVTIPAITEPPVDLSGKGVGDITSDAKGSGARFNSGKAPVELVPVWIIAADQNRDTNQGAQWEAWAILYALGRWQRGEAIDVFEPLAAFEGDWTTDCAAVFDYGRKKYAEWNWAKGMPWSVPTGCAVRHLLAILRGEENDPESGLPHRGHVACNLVMLAQYESTYREGDDRPLKWIAPPKAA